MTVDRSLAPTDAATMDVHFSPSNSEAPAPAPTRIPLTHQTNSEILTALVNLTRATPVEATAEEREELQSLEQARAKSARDSALSLEVRARQRREEELLEQARGDVGGVSA